MHPTMFYQLIHPKRATRFLFILFIASSFFSDPTFAAPMLRCKIEQSGTTHLLDFSPGNDPYTVAAIPINRHFRFKAVVIGNEHKVDYIKIYAYYQADRQAILMHEAKYLTPVPQTADAAPFQLTGMNYLYSPNLNREMQYGCSLIDSIASTPK